MLRVGLKIDLAFLMQLVRFVDGPVRVEYIYRRGRGFAPVLKYPSEIDTQDDITQVQ